ncbi:MAG: 1-acyl-sn-glycerol-3-phosphate acyltransferase [Cytophagaceae bacterium]|jgi:1-acyl-sn-glycerol-3-phosphate acyltransferase|nr:1-acyl-sn-glycerol-3-phosphate acyltransferase [Cytophagaceae bacterium]
MSKESTIPWYYWIYQPYKWLVFLPLFVVITIACAVIAVIFSIVISAKAGSWWGMFWGRVICYITPLRISVEGKENIEKGKSYVIAANHQTVWDIFLLYGFLPVDFKWVMKRELRKIPFVGYACLKMGHVFINRTSAKAALHSLDEAKRKLVNGTSILIFPEGTRSGQKEMRPFKRGAFKMAADLGLDILPVTVINSYKIFCPGFFNLLPARSGLKIHHPISINECDGDIEQLKALTRKALENYTSPSPIQRKGNRAQKCE